MMSWSHIPYIFLRVIARTVHIIQIQDVGDR